MPNLSTSSLITLACQVLAILGTVSAQSTNTTASSGMPEYTGILRYMPSVVGNVAFGSLYGILALAFSGYIWKHNNKWALCLPLGALASSSGFFIRLALDPLNISLPLFIVQQLFVVVSPSAFLAFNYMLYGRLITAIDPKFGNGDSKGSKMERSRFSFIPPQIVGRTFVWSDVITFLVQMFAGGLQAAGEKNYNLVNIGDKLFLAGVTAQGLSYVLFTTLLTVTLKRLIVDRRSNPSASRTTGMFGLDRDTNLLVTGLYFSGIFIILRSVYRIVEFTQGYTGYLITHEVYLFALDAGPLVLAIGVWAFIWPTVLLNRIATQVRQETQSHLTVSISPRVQSNGKSDWVPLV
ncbi:hypothetical protein BGX28_000275 [Mortierella sp. GBA30]|nr:hypothetical protein BGX28_000275 [Mortierella sp. GBA30]